MSGMTRSSILAVALIALAGPVSAQVYPYSPTGRPDLTTGDVHRYEMDRLRNQSDRSQALAQSQTAQTRATIQSLQARRQPPLDLPEARLPLTLDEARQARQASQARSDAVVRPSTQIDTWLDRRPQ